MTGYPPKLVEVAESEFGSVLTLTNSHTVPINIRPERLNQALREFERPSLCELLASRSLGVFADTWQTRDRDWERVSEIVQASPVAVAKLHDFPGIWRVFGQPAAVVRELPQRVYGGLEQALYTSHVTRIPVPGGPQPSGSLVPRFVECGRRVGLRDVGSS